MSAVNKRNPNFKKNAKVEQIRIQNILKMHANKGIDLNNEDNKRPTGVDSSPRKRQLNNSSNRVDESPNKKFKQRELLMASPSTTAMKPKSLMDTFSSTPQRNKHKPSFENLCKKNEHDDGEVKQLPQLMGVGVQRNQTRNDSLSSSVYFCDDEKIERNLSKSWIDIMEDLEEQGKELKDYIEKVKIKYKKTDEELLNNIETDTETLKKRQKKINYGKVTQEYKRYISQVARKNREAFHPRTPNKFRKCSRRKFDGLIKKWRKLLHVWDESPEKLKSMQQDDDDEDEEGDCEDFNVDDDINFIEFYESFSSLNSINEVENLNKENKENKDSQEYEIV